MKKQIAIGILWLLPFLNKAQNIVPEPIAGKIKTEIKDTVLNITTLTLSNGMKVLLKPTDTEPGVVYFAVLSPMGTSEYSNADYSSAFNAPQVVKMAGAGKLDQKALQKYLTGRKVSINPVVVKTYSVFNNRSSTADLATALELNYAYITSPQIDKARFEANIKETIDNYKPPVETANSFFRDTIALIENNFNTRYLQTPVQTLKAINQDRSLQIFKQLFADASTFTAIFVGQFDPQTIKPLLEKYLASLPATSKHKTAKDAVIYPPTGKIEKVFYKGTDTRAHVELLYSGFTTYTKKAEYVVDILQNELNKRLTSRLKTEDPDLYGLCIDISLNRGNKPYFTATLEFACNPSKTESLTKSLTDEIRKIEGDGPLQIDLKALKTEMISAVKGNQNSNSFWLAYLKKQSQYNENPADISNYPTIIESITPEDIKKAATIYFNGKNRIRFVLMPEAIK
ncbi:MAG: M16 family metallopeptidase [Mucilaginibacter sp.]|uniref:M16 family metallopeptidase n=1 Tax=Mucilaginibacter sp. TaxID=1882438 RepID=UPI0034E5705D